MRDTGSFRRFQQKVGWARQAAHHLTAGIPQRVRLYGVVARLLAGGRSGTLHLTWRGTRFSYAVRGIHDVGTLVEVFVAAEYEAAVAPDRASILDLGANTGAASIYLALRFPDAVIHAYEPDSGNVDVLRRNTAAFPGIRVWHAAVGAHDGTIRFHEDPTTGNSSSVMRRRDRQRAVDVPAVSLATALSRLPSGHAHLVKYDIEGAEYQLFGDPSLTHRMDALIGEHHHDLGADDVLMTWLQQAYRSDVRILGHGRTLVTSVRLNP